MATSLQTSLGSRIPCGSGGYARVETAVAAVVLHSERRSRTSPCSLQNWIPPACRTDLVAPRAEENTTEVEMDASAAVFSTLLFPVIVVIIVHGEHPRVEVEVEHASAQ
ncbi:hypothetical protein GUJ93_ZPchr0012g22147 [Zizania palustris]|uniref:Uncharacterized protein n=1 Tax=Zizania palustris TaxID=103762 RepID=A0A8J5WRZ5_ZIZPA|nr:hypothetical protein GUJ93_ZPchr0012g22147 [Zizania palustris]